MFASVNVLTACPLPGCLTLEDAAERLGMNTAAVQRLIGKGSLTVIRGFVTLRSLQHLQARHGMAQLSKVVDRAVSRRTTRPGTELVSIDLDAEPAGGVQVFGTFVLVVNLKWSPRGNLPEAPEHEGWITRGIDDAWLEGATVNHGLSFDSLPTPQRQRVLGELSARFEDDACERAIEQRSRMR